MNFVDKVYSSFIVLAGAGFAVMLLPAMEGMFIPALNNAGMYGIIAWGPIVIPVVYSACVFITIILLFVKIWKSESEE